MLRLRLYPPKVAGALGRRSSSLAVRQCQIALSSKRYLTSKSDTTPTGTAGPPWPTNPVIPKENTPSSASPAADTTVDAATGSSTPPPPPPPPPKKKRHHIRNFFLFLTFLTGSAFAGGVYYSLENDNFHDFFTEYIPFGEEAVLYFEEREFQKRFPNALARLMPKKGEVKVTIPERSGATWKIYEPEAVKTTDLGGEGPHIKSEGPTPEASTEATVVEAEISTPDPIKPKILDEVPIPAPSGPAQVEAAQEAASTSAEKTKEESPAGSPDSESLIVPLELHQDADPVIQDLVKVVNSIIYLANESNNAEIFESAVTEAKSELSRLSDIVTATKRDAQETLNRKLQEQELEFAKAAQGILARVDQEAQHINEQYQEQLDMIREGITEAYRGKLQTELKRSAQIAEQRLKNELLEQAIEMKRKWIKEIKDRVEAERGGRLGKLKELSQTVDELEAITSQWAKAVQANINTQQLHVAIEAVRNVVDDPQQPRPFVRELAALKDIADDDEVVRAAIASINPRAYQKGISSAAQLTDRFRRVSAEVRKAALLPEDAGVAGHASSWLLSKLLFRKKGLAVGEDVESILTRTETYLEEGDLDNAAREMNQLTGWAKALARDWLNEARLLLEVKQAIEVIGIQARLRSLRST